MNENTATLAFTTLGHATRLDVFPSCLNFHAAALQRAGLVAKRHEGRHIFHTANFTAMGALVDSLTRDCCGGHSEVCRAGSAR